MPKRWAGCDWPVVDDAALEARIEALEKRVKDSAWKDHASLIELTRLQLLASGGMTAGATPSMDGAQLNAKRAMAVDPTPPARLVAALALLHAHLPRTESVVARQMLFALVEGMLDMEAASPSPALQQARALVGYHRLISAGPAAAPLAGGAQTPLGGFARQVRDDWQAGQYARARLATYPALSTALRTSRVPRPRETAFEMLPGNLAPAPPPITPCDGAAKGTPEGKAFCGAAQALEASPSETTAKGVLDAYRGLKPACAAKEPQCGKHVPETMIATGAAFAEAGQMAKAIAVYRIAEPMLPASDVKLRISDAYFRIGVFDLAARWGIQHARAQGWNAPGVLRRVLAIELALGKPASSIDGLHRALRHRGLPAKERRAAAALAVRTIPAPERAAWLAKLPAEIRPPLPSTSTAGAASCDPALLCGYVAVLNDPTWSTVD